MSLKHYTYLFFDLDRTLWDFESNMQETMQEMYDTYLIGKVKIACAAFVQQFNHVHELLWEQYRQGHIKKKALRHQRFYLSLKKSGLDDPDLANTLNAFYLETCPMKTHLFPNTLETLTYLREKYKLYILTNGFMTTQVKKLSNCGLMPFFQHIFSSEKIGYNKPDPRIFASAINSLNATKKQCLMIGDDLKVDIIGAATYGIDQVYFNPGKVPYNTQVTFEINHLKELQHLL